MAGVAGASSLAIKVVALYDSLRKGSFHRGLIHSVIELSNQDIKGMEIKYIDIYPLPMLNIDLGSVDTYPLEWEVFRWKILVAEGVLFASAGSPGSPEDSNHGIKVHQHLVRFTQDLPCLLLEVKVG